MVADRKTFEQQKARLRDAILHDPEATRAEQRIGYEIADHLNFRSGDAWPSQEYLAQRTGYSVKTVERATKRLAGTGSDIGSWFARQFDGRGYRYVPKFERLDQANTRQNVGDQHPTSATGKPDIGDRNTRQNVGLSSLREPNREPIRASVHGSDACRSSRQEGDERERKDVVSPFAENDLQITAAAASGGAPRFVFENSAPSRAWEEYRESHGIRGPLPTTQHMVAGRWRTGWFVPTLWPPGYGRVKQRRLR